LPSSNPRLTFGDIVENIDRILGYTAGKSEREFAADQMLLDATERCLSRISEAAVKLGEQADTLAPGIAWRDIRGLGNHLRHDYRGVRHADIWHIVSHDLRPLRDGCIAAQKRLSDPER
jgi:uncharacterized protein with HEPN domain